MSRQDVDLDHGDHDYNSSRHLYNWLLKEGEICPNTIGPTRMTACEKCVYDTGTHAAFCQVGTSTLSALESLGLPDDATYTIFPDHPFYDQLKEKLNANEIR